MCRKDERIYTWLLNVENNEFINNQLVFQNFCKGVKDVIEKIDTNMLTDDEINNIYNDIMYKSIFIVNYMKDNNVKFSSNQRTEFFKKAQDIEYTNEEELTSILDSLV